jgi:hypothetical protein
MTRQAGITLGIIAVVAVLAGGIAFTQINKPKTQSDQTAGTDPSASTSAAAKGSINDLLSAGKSVTCEMSYPDGQGSGTVFVATPNFRGDFVVKAGGEEMVSHMIQSAGYAYVWTDAKGQVQGTKFKTDTLKSTSPAPGVQSQTADLNAQVDMKCSAWTVDNSKFVIPGDVKFTDVSSLVKQAQPKATGSATSSGAAKVDKSLCDSIKDETAKAACVRALGAN